MLKLDQALAQSIVDRSMKIIDGNVNVMDDQGRIIASGDRDRIGQTHGGALLVLAKGARVDIDGIMAGQLTGVLPGVNLPLLADGLIVGCVGLTGDPTIIHQHAALVQMAAETMLEQAGLLRLLARDARLREEVTLGLIRDGGPSPALGNWAKRLGIDLALPRVAAVIEVDNAAMPLEAMLVELQRLHTLLATPERGNLIAATSLNELVILKPALSHRGLWNPEEQRHRAHDLLARMKASSPLPIRLALGQYFPGSANLARSCEVARTTMRVGKARCPDASLYCYEDFMLPVLVDGLRRDWRSDELLRPLLALSRGERSGKQVLRQTLETWFAVGMKPAAATKALHLHRNTLDYRLRRIEELCDIDLSVTEDCVRLYLALQMDPRGTA
ncbi:MAG: helix-turn-helix domain-containing protein [Sphingomonas paucimobilis]